MPSGCHAGQVMAPHAWPRIDPNYQRLHSLTVANGIDYFANHWIIYIITKWTLTVIVGRIKLQIIAFQLNVIQASLSIYLNEWRY